MKFRTEIEKHRPPFTLTHHDHIVMLGSCFTDHIGQQLSIDGFDVVANPMGPLYNPMSIARVFHRLGQPYQESDLIFHDGKWHCLDFASKYSDASASMLLKRLNDDFLKLSDAICHATVLIITFGTAYVFKHNTAGVVGNCHKIPTSYFSRNRLLLNDICNLWKKIPLPEKTIFTVSPIRHLADGLEGNSVSKSILRLACEEMPGDYFPSFEIMIDDLRDYRFYNSDMKHPSPVAVDYIYEKFKESYFEAETCRKAGECRKEFLRTAHRPIL